MKLIIDEKACKKHKMTLIEVLYALAIKEGLTGNDVQEMLSKEILVEGQDSWYMVTQHWNDVVEEILADSLGTVERTDEEIAKLALEVQKCFPKIKMRDKYGKETSYWYTCNKPEISKALKRFFAQYGNYSDEEIIDATKRYVATFNDDYTGMRIAKYFIIKDRIMQGEDGGYKDRVSDLLTFLENKEEDDSDDWQNRLV